MYLSILIDSYISSLQKVMEEDTDAANSVPTVVHLSHAMF